MTDTAGTFATWRMGSDRESVRHSIPLPVASWTGRVRDGVACYYGIRYAQLSDPANPRSQAVAAAGQVIVADMVEVPVFRQLPSRLEAVTGLAGRLNPQNDEAFFLNVWAPEHADNLPVLVFVHGGAWASGGGAMRWYRGEQLARDGIVVVTLNYRLGPAGHLDSRDAAEELHHPFGDIMLALQWVKRYIDTFGGDPDRVTLAGQSAGAWYSWALASLPEAAGLFRQVALLSIPEIHPWSPEYRRAFTDQVEAICRMGGEGTEPLGLLRAGAQVLAEAPRVAGAMPPMYLPMLSGDSASWLSSAASAAEHQHVEALYVRWTRHEMSVFLPPFTPGSQAAEETLRELRARCSGENVPHHPAPSTWGESYAEAVELSSWLEFGRFSHQIANEGETRGIKVTMREFIAEAGQPAMGSVHCIDLPFQFGNQQDWNDAPMLAGWSSEDFDRVSREIRADLVNFVTGQEGVPYRLFGQASGVRPI